MGFDVGGSSGSGQTQQSTAFSRSGGASSNASFDLGSSLRSLIESNQSQYGGGSDKSRLFLDKMIEQDTCLPGVPGLKAGATLNPFGGSYEQATQDQFSNRLQKALMASRTGLENSMAPLNRGKEFREAEVIGQASRDREDIIRNQRNSDFQILLNSFNGLNAGSMQASDIMNRTKGANIAGLGGTAELTAPKISSTNENFSGVGNQLGSSNTEQMQVGLGANICCFIFLEVYNGKLPWWVRECRDKFYTPARRAGYTWMSKWLVPAMQKNFVVRTLTNLLMVKPLTLWGGFHKNVKGYRNYWFLKPVVLFWFLVWDLLGEDKKD